MEVLMPDFRFVSSQLNGKLLKADIGEAFQRFVHELLLHEYPTLHLFKTGGKDGGIDLSVQDENSRVFIECKHITTDSINTAQSRWREVAKHLQCHISDRSQPTVGQRQYWPWYGIETPVIEYIFCISSMLANQDQIDRLQGEISDFFKEISRSHSRLAHLESISVKVLDWNDLSAKMMQFPQVLLRWFPRSRPIGLIPIDDFSEIGSFRSYLYSDMLTYYARHSHLQVFPAPTGSAIPDEEELFLELTRTELAGLIITGKGGVGKTRLTLEIGRLARRKGWLVLRCRGNLSADTIIQLAEIINKDNQVLIVADYVEVQREFNEFVETLLALNDTYDLQIRYVANCRVSYYHSLAALPFHKQYNLSPSSQEPELKWVQGFQKAVVRHILECSLLKVAHEHLEVCRNKPVFAVFLSYLFRSGRGEELAEILGEKDFSRWVAKRLQLSFGEMASTRKLAQLMVLFPLPNDSLHHPDLQDSLPILERLASDGWMEKPSGEKSNQKAWEVAHDVLADQIILSYLESTQATSQFFLQDALSNAAKVGSFRSALVTMQRITDQPPLTGIKWFEILARHIGEKHNIPLQVKWTPWSRQKEAEFKVVPVC
jgi:hypothetical protein